MDIVVERPHPFKTSAHHLPHKLTFVCARQMNNYLVLESLCSISMGYIRESPHKESSRACCGAQHIAESSKSFIMQHCMNYDFAVVGSGGLIGSAALKYLSAANHSVAGIGSPEPRDFSVHDDVFASHYDEARVTRVLDANPIWAGLAHESLKRFPDIQTASGISFYETMGCLRVGAPDTIAELAKVGAAFGAVFELLDNAVLKRRFAFVESHDLVGVMEQGLAGTLAPRALVRAQLTLANRNGAHLYEDVVLRIETAAMVVLMPVPEALLERNVPALIYYRWLNATATYLYATPPIRYDDGGCYMKAGALNDGMEVQSLAQAVDYFRSGGNRDVAVQLAQGAHLAIPAMQPVGYKIKPCILANTATGLPYISAVIPGRLYVAAGGCGAAAKSSDEIGRLASALVLGRDECVAFQLPREPRHV